MVPHLRQYKTCDPLHGFIRFDALERRVIDSRPFQRLRMIRQMGNAYLVYPGAHHTRFEHSLGVMELATRLFEGLVLHCPSHMLPSQGELDYWRRLLRLAALCHDLGHLPFSHVAERVLLPHGGHERMTLLFLHSDEMQEIWRELPFAGRNPLDDLTKLVLREEELASLGAHLVLTPWERMLSQVITEDNFGADRIDYLLRDAHATGVGCGIFDADQLMDTLRILPGMRLGVTIDGVQSIESLWMARYLMYSRVYHLPKCRIHTHHLRRFMEHHYAEYGLPQDVEGYLDETDVSILTALARSSDPDACSLTKRRRTLQEVPLPREEVRERLQALQAEFGDALLVDDFSEQAQVRERLRHFIVLDERGEEVPSVSVSEFLRDIPLGGRPLRLFVEPEKEEEVREFLHFLAPLPGR